jgi:hypothetical protein
LVTPAGLENAILSHPISCWRGHFNFATVAKLERRKGIGMSMIEVAVLASIWALFTVIFLFWLHHGYCRHQWEKGEVKEYPQACPGPMTMRGDSEDIIKLKSSHTTYVQRCAKCGLEKYHTERRP